MMPDRSWKPFLPFSPDSVAGGVPTMGCESDPVCRTRSVALRGARCCQIRIQFAGLALWLLPVPGGAEVIIYLFS